jgi:hypothetical protein
MVDQNQQNGTKVQKDSESFGKLPKDSEEYGNFRNVSERKETHIINIKEATKMFEKSGVARTERSIINWCYPNKQGISRLDCFYDNNERKWFITPQSVDLAIKEEIARVKNRGLSHSVSVLDNSETSTLNDSSVSKKENEDIKKLNDENFLLKIDNSAKEQVIVHLKQQIEADRELNKQTFEEYKNELVTFSHQVGTLKTKLLLLEGGGKEKMQSEGSTDSKVRDVETD